VKRLIPLVSLLVIIAASFAPTPAHGRGVSAPDRVAAIAAQYGAPAWAVTACTRSLSREHYDCGGCARCLRNIRRGRSFAGPLQMSHSWNRGRAGCSCDGGHSDWRLCLDCSIGRFMSVAVRGGKRAVKRQWGQTCGRL
jgi:hypothetical protein